MRRLLIVVQFVVTAGLLAYAVTNIGTQQVAAALSGASVSLLVAAMAVLLLQFPLAGWRWRRIVMQLGGKLNLMSSIRMVWAGAFFSQVLPSSIGGDAVRIWLACRSGIGVSNATTSVTLDRIVMFLTLVLLTLLASQSLNARVEIYSSVWMVTLIAIGTIGGMVTLAFSGGLFSRFARAHLIRIVDALATDLRGIILNPRFFLLIALISIVSILNLVFVAWIACVALGIDVSLWTCIKIFPAVFLLSSLPVSISGWGVREGLVVALLAADGVPASSALAASVSFGLISALVSLPGAVGILGLRRQMSASTSPPTSKR